MIIEDFDRDIKKFEISLQKIVTDIASEDVSETLPLTEMWNRFESRVTSLQNLAKQVMENMLLLKPEKTPIIKKTFMAMLSPLNAFKQALLQESVDHISSARRALEELRKITIKGSEFLNLAKEVESSPSEVINEILKLREIHESKEYLSSISIPEAAHVQLMVLRRYLENLRLHTENLERSLEEMMAHIDVVEEEIRKPFPSPTMSREEPEKESDK